MFIPCHIEGSYKDIKEIEKVAICDFNGNPTSHFRSRLFLGGNK